MYAKLAVLAVLVAAVMGGSLRNDEGKLHLFCGACKDVFKGLKHALPEGVPITKEILKTALDLLCDELSVVSGLCKAGVEAGLDELFHIIVENENYDPEAICKALKLC